MRIALSILLLLIFIPSWSEDERLLYLGRDAAIRVEPVILQPGKIARRRVGQLTWLGGVRLTSPDPAFGGFSALLVAGRDITLLSDGGSVAWFSVDSRLRVVRPRFGRLPGGPGNGWKKRDRDSESMTIDPVTGKIWVGFEDANQLWRYAPGLARAEARAAPPVMRDWDRNGGAEAMTRLRDGRFIVLSETSHWPNRPGRAAILFSHDPVDAPRAGFRFVYLPPRGYDPSDMAVLPDGRLIVLNRRFALPYDFTAKLTIVDPRAIRRGALVRGREIATLAAPLIHDNFEGVAVTREGRDTMLWIVSDDNLSILQKTLLLKFRLESGVP